MNFFTYEQISVGQSAEFMKEITEPMMDQFCDISGDVNPLHCNMDYAVQHGFCGRVVYGLLTASMYSTLAGVYLPGERSILYEVECKFCNPVFIGDFLTISGKVKEKNDTFRMITVKAEIFNQNGTKVSRATMKIGFQSEMAKS